jgi:hypothetical protein
MPDSAIQRRARRDADRVAVFAHYGTVCACPGCGATEDLTIDHPDGDGQEHRRAVAGNPHQGGHEFYRRLIAQGFPDGLQTMCGPCNKSKGNGPACRLWHGDPGKKRCLGPCDQVKPLGDFRTDNSSRDGLTQRCRDCLSAAARAYRARLK